MEWLRKTKDLCLLSAVEHRLDALDDSLPFWVPRWDFPLANDYLGLYYPGFDASKGCVKIAPEFTINAGLRVRGLIFDNIHFRSEIFSNPISLSDNQTSLILSIWNRLVGATTNQLCAIWKLLSHQKLPFAYNGFCKINFPSVRPRIDIKNPS